MPKPEQDGQVASELATVLHLTLPLPPCWSYPAPSYASYDMIMCKSATGSQPTVWPKNGRAHPAKHDTPTRTPAHSIPRHVAHRWRRWCQMALEPGRHQELSQSGQELKSALVDNLPTELKTDF